MKKILFLLSTFLCMVVVSAQTKEQWLDALGKVANSFQKKGRIVFYAPKYPDCEVTYIGIQINNKIATIKRFDEVPSCRNADPDSYPIFELAPGGYKFTGEDLCGNKYYGDVSISSGECKLVRLYMP